MAFVAGFIAPHAPVLIPEIGGARRRDIQTTLTVLAEAAELVKKQKPEVVVIISPHSPMADSAFALHKQAELVGSFEAFGCTERTFRCENDLRLIENIESAAEAFGIPVCEQDPRAAAKLDWGVLVPYNFLGNDLPIVSLAPAHLSLESHYRFGRALKKAAEDYGKKAVFIASGDLSHRLSPDSPYGYSFQGPLFDNQVCRLIKECRLEALLDLSGEMISGAGECGLRSMVVLAGALSNTRLSLGPFSYEGPFGVGYLVAALMVEGESDA